MPLTMSGATVLLHLENQLLICTTEAEASIILRKQGAEKAKASSPGSPGSPERPILLPSILVRMQFLQLSSCTMVSAPKTSPYPERLHPKNVGACPKPQDSSKGHLSLQASRCTRSNVPFAHLTPQTRTRPVLSTSGSPYLEQGDTSDIRVNTQLGRDGCMPRDRFYSEAPSGRNYVPKANPVQEPTVTRTHASH